MALVVDRFTVGWVGRGGRSGITTAIYYQQDNQGVCRGISLRVLTSI